MTIKNDEKIISLLEKIVAEKTLEEKRHEEEHEFLRKLMKEYNERLEILSSIKKRLIVGTVWSMAMATLASVGYSIKIWLSH